MSGDELHQRIEALKIRRKNDRINKILYCAAKGDLVGMKLALKVGVSGTCSYTKCCEIIYSAA